MELAHLVPAGQLSVTGSPVSSTPRVRTAARWVVRRPVVHFFALAVLALIGERLVRRAFAPRPTITVLVPPGLSARDRESRVDSAILIEEGIALGWVRSDPLIRARLVENLRFARGESVAGSRAGARGSVRERAAARDRALLEEAIQLDMPRTDLVIRRRLVGRAERLLASDVRNAPVSDATLLAFRDAHLERFRAPARFRYTEVFVSRQRHADAYQASVVSMGERLRGGGISPSAATEFSDPLLYSARDRFVSADEVDRYLGGHVADGLAASGLGVWAGPFESEYGAHFVWLLERREPALPTLEEARARILGAYRDARQERAVRARMAELRARYRVHIVAREGTP